MTPATIMVRLTPGQPNGRILRLAAGIAGQFKARRLIGIAACQPMQYFGDSGSYVPQDLVNQDHDQMERDLGAAEKEFRSTLNDTRVELGWRSVVTIEPLSGFIAREIRAADMLITGRSEASLFDNTRHVEVAATVMAAGRPVLVAGSEADQLDLRHALVAWKDTREARRAVEDALPFLKLAGTVTLAEVAEAEDLEAANLRLADVSAWLKQHGVAATARVVVAKDSDAVHLAELAQQTGAGVVVAGAYGHSRLTEWVLGGVTRDFLLNPLRCSFLSH